VIYIWIRRTTDWADEAAFRAQLPAALVPKVRVWDDTFAMPFQVFRARVAEVARLNVSRVEGAAVAAWDDIPDGALVAPVDDDVWFAPDLARALEEAPGDGAVVCHWRRTFLERPIGTRHALALATRRVFPALRAKYVCATNSYAVVKGPETRALAESHVSASRWVRRAGTGAVSIDRRLSLMNRTLASQTSLAYGRRTVSRAQLVRKHAAYRELYRAGFREPSLAWASPYIEMMSDLMSELEVRPR
jgi:hypothetical protein